ncbi:MAG: hypothetical protein COU30_03855, partial [Candidatus Magasanikbacteria bacterium CG10_big_fil_rev_8_21_14_0_10_38_6]
MKNILIITLEHPPEIGGIASYVDQFAAALPEQNNVTVYAPYHPGDANWDRTVSYTIIRKKPYFPIGIWPRWLRMYFQVRKIVKERKIDIIFLHHILPVGYVAWLMKKTKKIPYVIFSHGTDILAATKTKWKKRMAKMVCTQSESIVFNSESLKHRLVKELPEFEQKSLVLYPCPDDALYHPPAQDFLDSLKSQYALEGKKVMLSIGRFEDGKGFPHIIRILPKLLEKIPNLVWLVIGDGKKQEKLVTQVQKNSLQNIVRFLGKVPHNEVVPFYYIADIFTLLTHPDEGKEEGLGLVFLEAAAAGLPVVA